MCLVLEWVSKGSLADFLQDTGQPLRWDDPLLRLATDVARGMAYLHGRELIDEYDGQVKNQCIIHRDLKPDNVLITEFSAAKVTDFGTSRAKSIDDVKMTAVGTPLFCAPEIARGEAYDESVDVYSFGLTLLDMTTEQDILELIGERWAAAFDKKKIPKQPNRIIRSMTEDGWRPVTAENPVSFAPETINALLVRCCAHEPKERPSFVEIVSCLEVQCEDEIGRTIDFWTRQPHPTSKLKPMESDDDFEIENFGRDDNIQLHETDPRSSCASKSAFPGNPTVHNLDELDDTLFGDFHNSIYVESGRREIEDGGKIEQLFDSDGKSFFVDRARKI